MTQQELLKFAIRGLEAERSRIDELLTELKAQVNPTQPLGAKPQVKRSISAEGRANIRAALKRRWKAYHEGKATAPNAAVSKKRTLSQAQLAAMRRNAAKARAALKRTAAAK